jgi:AcrR family transcriptional regulator
VTQADVALQTFYRYFSSWDQLLLAVIDEMISETCQMYEE